MQAAKAAGTVRFLQLFNPMKNGVYQNYVGIGRVDAWREHYFGLDARGSIVTPAGPAMQ
jgi:hypothetical protein